MSTIGRSRSLTALWPLYALVVALVILLAAEAGSSFPQLAFSLTGEEELLPQVTGLIQLAFNLTRPP
ncbi:MAG: hypothetical protein ACP5R2_10935, partial [Anaerolineae bacterium]